MTINCFPNNIRIIITIMSSKGKWITKTFEEIKNTINEQPKKPLPKEDDFVFQKPKLSERRRQPLLPKTSNFNFLKELEPKTVKDLAVHSKKITELESWLEQYALKPSNKSALLLLTGPSGCGKTVTTQVLCKSKFICVHEWLNPSNYYAQDLDDTYHDYQSQAQQFFEFVVESKYGNLLTGSAKNICLVKEYPNIFLKKPEEFIQTLEDISNVGGVRVIFIATEDSGISTNIERILFPDDVRSRFAIGTISFNACAVTLMKTAVKRALKLAQAYPDLFDVPSNNVIDAICAASNGDIRCCINQFHLAALKGCIDISVDVKTEVSKGTKRKRATSTATLKTRLKDESLGLFHSIGRVLHPKIDPATQRIHHDLGALVDEFGTMPRVFIGYMHENYLRHFGDVEDGRRASADLSLAQCYLDKWTERHEIYTVGLYIAVMSLMLNNKHRVTMWNPIRAPPKIKQAAIMSRDRFVPSTDACYYNFLVKKEKFNRFEQKL